MCNHLRRYIWLSVVVLLAILTGLVSASCSPAPAGVLGRQEKVRLLTPQGEVEVVTKIDTGSVYSSLDERFARSLGLQPEGKKVIIITAQGREERETVKLTFILADRRVNGTATLADRSGFSTLMLIGTDDLGGFLVDPSREFLTQPGQPPQPSSLSPSAPAGPFGTLETEGFIIIIPILASVVVVLRRLVGVKTYGVFAPVVIAISLLDTALVLGLGVYAFLMGIGIGARLLLLRRLRLPFIAEIALIIFILVLGLQAVSALPLGLTLEGMSLFFRLIVTSFLIEQASRTVEEHSMREMLPLLGGSFAVAVLLTFYGGFLLGLSQAGLWVVFALSILAVILTGHYYGLRLSEVVRFKFLRKTHVHQ